MSCILRSKEEMKHWIANNLSNPAETEDVVISILEPENEEVHVSPAATVAKEHDRLHDVDVKKKIDREGGDEAFNGDDSCLKDFDFTGIISDDISSGLDLNLDDDDDFGPLSGFVNRHFKRVDEVAQAATKTGDTLT
ncbi:unnamed protein product [Lactuca saligna]|uniref:Uncharacterized protein n=1 Tax=Lactuca saligna TaxID=75948 RepID=A0AA36E2U0_LACSI|nr:unnamed protein product [Lactuca saligna]